LAVGAWIEFRCGSCGYEVMVSGGDDEGFFSRTTTVVCEECEELYDVVTFGRSETTNADEGDDLEPVEPECPRSSRHTLRRWTHPGACPRCEDTMMHGEKITMWD